jgi:hypothetical protein
VSEVEQITHPFGDTNGHSRLVDDDETFEVEIAEAGAGSSVLSALKAQRARVASTRTYDVVVPGWNELLVLRLGPINGGQQQRIIDRAQRGKTANVDLDFLVAAFQQVLGRKTPEGELAVLVDADGDAVGLDERLAAMLDLGHVQTARQGMLALFAGANAPSLAITSAANEYLEWARSANTEIDEDFLGES